LGKIQARKGSEDIVKGRRRGGRGEIQELIVKGEEERELCKTETELKVGLLSRRYKQVEEQKGEAHAI